MTRMITAMFDTRAAADAAADQMRRELSLAPAAVRVHAGSDVSDAPASGRGDESPLGFWAALRDLFVPDDDRTTYAEGLRRGAVLVSAEVDEERIDQAMDVLEANGAIDLESSEAEWRGSPSDDATASMPASPAIGVAGTTREPVISRPGGAGGDFSNHPAPGSMTDAQGRQVGAGMSTGAVPRTAMPTPAPSTTGPATKPLVPSGRDTEEAIPLAEERIHVGKRDVERGRVRVRSYIVETPVNEQVTLRDEHVDVQRRSVDRAAKPGDDLFRERTIEAVERGEEAVVSKETRVTGEVVLGKDRTEHTETVRDTVRRTEVDVEGQPGKPGPTARDTPAKPSGPLGDKHTTRKP